MIIEKIIITDKETTQEIQMSVDDHKKFDIIIGDNGSGKTVMFNKIKSFFTQKKESKIIFNGNPSLENSELIFMDSEKTNDLNQIFKNRKFSEDKLHRITDDAKGIIISMDERIFPQSHHHVQFFINDGKVVL